MNNRINDSPYDIYSCYSPPISPEISDFCDCLDLQDKLFYDSVMNGTNKELTVMMKDIPYRYDKELLKGLLDITLHGRYIQIY